MNLKIQYHYRWNFLLTILVDPIMLVIQIMMVRTLFSYNGTDIVLGYSAGRMIWYLAATRFYSYLVWSFPDKDLVWDVFSGSLGLKLVKPVSLMHWEFNKTVAAKICCIAFSFLPNFIIFLFICPPAFLVPAAIVKYFILNIFAFILFFLISFLLGIIALRWQSKGAITAVKMIFLNLASGGVLPLDFFPAAVRKILQWLPFHYLSYVPIRIFLNMPGMRSWEVFQNALFMMAFWILIFYGLCKLCWASLLRFHTVAGG